MRTTFIAAATVLSMAAVPALAQVHDVDDKRNMTPEQQAVYDAFDDTQRADFDRWDADRQTLYFGWNDALRGYYWSLDRDEKDAWWYLNDDQRVTLFQIQGEADRDAAWDSVIAQVDTIEAQNAQLAAREDARANTSNSGEINFVSNARVQNVPAARSAPDGEYPVCQSDNDDQCINAWAAGMRGSDVTRPLDYWPGQPASEMSGG